MGAASEVTFWRECLEKNSGVAPTGSDTITDSSKGGAPMEVRSGSTHVAAKIPGNVVSKPAPDKSISGHGVTSPRGRCSEPALVTIRSGASAKSDTTESSSSY